MSNPLPNGKSLAIIAYCSVLLLWIHLILCIAIYGVALLLNNNRNQSFASFHLRQMFGIILIAVIMSIFADSIPITIIPFIITFIILIAVLGLIGAIQNKTTPLPIIGPYFQRWFKFIS